MVKKNNVTFGKTTPRTTQSWVVLAPQRSRETSIKHLGGAETQAKVKARVCVCTVRVLGHGGILY